MCCFHGILHMLSAWQVFNTHISEDMGFNTAVLFNIGYSFYTIKALHFHGAEEVFMFLLYIFNMTLMVFDKLLAFR